MGGGLGRVTNHSDYYISDGTVSFLTGKTLFRVHRSFFERESEVFRDLFASAAEEDPQSGTDARPFTLDVQPDEFAQLLWVWYDREYSYRQQTKEGWVTILRLSTRWAFPKIKELAIRELDVLVLSPAERVAIYTEHGIDDERLFNSYVELCRSPTVPTKEEGHLMQMDTLINVLQAREDAQRRALELFHDSPTSAGLEDETLREIVSRFFPASLNPRSSGISTGSGVQASTLNGKRTQGTSAHATIILGEPQVPDRTQSASQQPSHVNSSLQTSDEGKANQENGEGSRADSNVTREEVDRKLQAEEEKRKQAKVTQDKEKEERERLERAREKAKQDKEREEKEKAERVKKAKEKEEEEKAEKARQEKEREREKAQKVGERQNPWSRRGR